MITQQRRFSQRALSSLHLIRSLWTLLGREFVIELQLPFDNWTVVDEIYAFESTKNECDGWMREMSCIQKIVDENVSYHFGCIQFSLWGARVSWNWFGIFEYHDRAMWTMAFCRRDERISSWNFLFSLTLKYTARTKPFQTYTAGRESLILSGTTISLSMAHGRWNFFSLRCHLREMFDWPVDFFVRCYTDLQAYILSFPFSRKTIYEKFDFRFVSAFLFRVWCARFSHNFGCRVSAALDSFSLCRAIFLVFCRVRLYALY